MSQVIELIADHPGMILTTVDVGSPQTETTSPRLALLPAVCPEKLHVSQHDESIDAPDNHVGGCLRGVLFALLIESVAVLLFVLLFKMWRMTR